jgi:outer membrane protein TolC
MRDYDRARFSLGLHYPLLGTLARERINVLKAEARTWESRQRIKLARLKSLEALRSQYILLWGSQEQVKLCRSFLTDELQVDRILQERKNKGLLLNADREEFLTAFALVHRNLANLKATEKRALANINLLTNGYSGTFSAGIPQLPAPCIDRAILRSTVLEKHPDIIRLRGLVEEQLGVINLARHSDIKAKISMLGHSDIDYPSAQDGYGLRLQFTMDMPWEFSRAGKAEAGVEQARLRKLQRQLDMVSGQLLADVDNVLQRYEAAFENKRFATQRVKAALEDVRERILRRSSLAGDTFEQLQRSRYQYYQAAMDYVDAEVFRLHATARLLVYNEDENRDNGKEVQIDSVINDNFLKPLYQLQLPRPDTDIPTLKENAKRKPKAMHQGIGVYAWNTTKLFALEKSNDAFWQGVRKNKITRMLLSFNRLQLDQLMLPSGEKELKRFIRRANDEGVSIGLLLGEPTWILPEHRRNLLNIVDRFQGMGFSVIHLDLEPNQLAHMELSDTYLLAHLLRTIQAVSRLSSLPVEIDLHPRYLRGETGDFCLGCGLQNLDDVSVTLMIYVSNPKRVAALAQPILEKFPEIPFSIAQSVEPQLGGDESYAGISRVQLQKKITALQKIFGNKVQNIYIQSWQDYMDMDDEH